MSNSKPKTLATVPLFTLGHACPGETNLLEVFTNWPSNKLQLLHQAQEYRDALKDNVLKESISVAEKLRMVDQYLPFALAIEKIKAENPHVKSNGKAKIRWKQSPIVVSKYIDRVFYGDTFFNEVLHLIWLRAVLLLNNAYVLYTSGTVEEAVSCLRECSGIFLYLANDRLRISTEPVAVEFQAPVFNSFSSLAIGQAYGLIAAKGEGDGINCSALGKLCYTISTTFSSSFDSVEGCKPPNAVHEQYKNWVNGIKHFFMALAAINMAYSQIDKQEIGNALGLIRLGIHYLDEIITYDRHNIRLNNASKTLADSLRPLEKKWTSENFSFQAKYVLPFKEAEMFITTNCISMPNLPQPTPFQLPDPAP